MHRKLTRIGIRGTAVAVVLAAASTGTAYAGQTDHGTDPTSWPNYCNRNAEKILTQEIRHLDGALEGVLEMYYSRSCGTNWLRVAYNRLGGWAEKDILADGQPYFGAEWDYGTGSSYTMQVYAPGSTCVTYDVALYSPGETRIAQASGRIC